MTIISDADYYRVPLLAEAMPRAIVTADPLTAFTIEVPTIPAQYSGLDRFYMQVPKPQKPRGLISETKWEPKGTHTVSQSKMEIKYKRVSGGGKVQQDDIMWLFDSKSFPSWPRGDSRWGGKIETSMRAYNEALGSLIKQINYDYFKTMGARSFIYSGSTDVKMWDEILGHVSVLNSRLTDINGGRLSEFKRLKSAVPVSYLDMIRTKSGQEFTQTSRDDTPVSVTKNSFQKLELAQLDLYLTSGINEHMAGKASEEQANKLVISNITTPDDYLTMKVTFTGGEAKAGYFKKGDIIRIREKYWLRRDADNISSYVPMAFAVYEDSDDLTVRVTPGAEIGVDIPNKEYLIDATATVEKDHRKAFMWSEEHAMFSIRSTPLPSAGFLSTVISGESSDYGPIKKLSMSAILESNKDDTGITEDLVFWAYLAGDVIPFYSGVMILPIQPPTPSSFTPYIRSKTV